MTVVKHIPVSEDWQSTNDYDSHRPLLFIAWENTEGVVLEMGCGNGSTNLLEQYCNIYSIPFLSFDTDEKWANKFTYAVHLSDMMLLPAMKVDLLFIDSKPGEQRKELIEKWANYAKAIVVHDTEPGARYVYGMEEILSTFKYRIDYAPTGKPWATAVSNTIDIPNQWLKHPPST